MRKLLVGLLSVFVVLGVVFVTIGLTTSTAEAIGGENCLFIVSGAGVAYSGLPAATYTVGGFAELQCTGEFSAGGGSIVDAEVNVYITIGNVIEAHVINTCVGGNGVLNCTVPISATFSMFYVQTGKPTYAFKYSMHIWAQAVLFYADNSSANIPLTPGPKKSEPCSQANVTAASGFSTGTYAGNVSAYLSASGEIPVWHVESITGSSEWANLKFYLDPHKQVDSMSNYGRLQVTARNLGSSNSFTLYVRESQGTGNDPDLGGADFEFVALTTGQSGTIRGAVKQFLTDANGYGYFGVKSVALAPASGDFTVDNVTWIGTDSRGTLNGNNDVLYQYVAPVWPGLPTPTPTPAPTATPTSTPTPTATSTPTATPIPGGSVLSGQAYIDGSDPGAVVLTFLDANTIQLVMPAGGSDTSLVVAWRLQQTATIAGGSYQLEPSLKFVSGPSETFSVFGRNASVQPGWSGYTPNYSYDGSNRVNITNGQTAVLLDSAGAPFDGSMHDGYFAIQLDNADGFNSPAGTYVFDITQIKARDFYTWVYTNLYP